MKIDQSAFIRDLIIDEGLTYCNAKIIVIKPDSSIDMTIFNNYEAADLNIYQRLIGKEI